MNSDGDERDLRNKSCLTVQMLHCSLTISIHLIPQMSASDE